MNTKKNVLIGILLVGIVAMTVAFAAFSTNLRINGSASVPDVNWNIHFDNWALDTASTVNGHQNTAEYPTANDLQKSLSPNITLVEGLDVILKQPGDYVKYTFQILNEGTIDASLDNFEKTLTCAQGNDCSHLSYEIECKDAASGGNNVLEIGSTLAVNQRAYCSLTVTYTDTTNQNSGNPGEVQTYTQSAASATLNANFQYVQKKSYYSYSTGSGTTTTEPQQDCYIRSNTATSGRELCGLFDGTTICFSQGDYEHDGDSINFNGEKFLNLKSRIETAINASCEINAPYNMTCNSSTISCHIDRDGYVACSTNDGYKACHINSNGTSGACCDYNWAGYVQSCDTF